MSPYPAKDKRAKSGSNLRGKPLLAHRTKALNRQKRLHNRLARKYRGQYGRLISKSGLRKAVEIEDQMRTKWREATVKLSGDASKIDALKASALRKMNGSLSHKLSHYRKLKSLRKVQKHEYHKLPGLASAAGAAGGMNISWGSATAVPADPIKKFKAPFTLYSVDLIDEKNLITNDQSYVSPSIGHLVNHITFHHRDDPAAIVSLFGLIRAEAASGLVSCGANFTMPRTGRLRIGAIVQNFWSKITLSITDNFGFSSATLEVTVQLFVDIVRGNDVLHLPTVILTKKLTSGGNNAHYAMPDLDNSGPYALAGTTLESLEAGEEMWIMIGSEVLIESKVDDMSTDVSALTWWGVKELTVEVI